jgi:hypothetical protein
MLIFVIVDHHNHYVPVHCHSFICCYLPSTGLNPVHQYHFFDGSIDYCGEGFVYYWCVNRVAASKVACYGLRCTLWVLLAEYRTAYDMAKGLAGIRISPKLTVLLSTSSHFYN